MLEAVSQGWQAPAMLLVVLAAQHIRVVNESSVQWWVIPLTTLGTVIIGALVAGWINRSLQRRAADNQRELQSEAWLRQVRADIYKDALPELADPFNDRVAMAYNSSEPIAQNKDLGAAYSNLQRAASAASKEDGDKVEGFLPIWNRIGYLHGSWRHEVEGQIGDRRAEITREHYEEQRAEWVKANELLKAYSEWLKDKLS